MTKQNLLEQLQIGNLHLKNRVVLAPLTRLRVDENHVPLDMVAEHYAQRGSVPGTLLISEATFPSVRAGGVDFMPGIYTEDQIKAWRKVTDAVHAKGSFIYCQLIAQGRNASPEVLARDGYHVISSGNLPDGPDGAVPEPLDETGIQTFITDFVQAAKNAVLFANFDGIEIHGANGYLIDQFTQDTCNNRTDRWGDSIENRARFGLAIAKQVSAAIGPERTAYRLSPWGTFQGMRMKDPRPQFKYLVDQLATLRLAYIHIVECRVSGSETATSYNPKDTNMFLIDAYGDAGAVILAGAFLPETANIAIGEAKRRGHDNVAIAFGRYFISNPDLPFRAAHDVALTPYDRSTFYTTMSPVGYVDYTFSEAFLLSKAAKSHNSEASD